MSSSPSQTPPPLLTVQEAAKLLRVSPMTVYRRLDDGTLTGVRHGRCLRVHRHTVVALIGPIPD